MHLPLSLQFPVPVLWTHPDGSLVSKVDSDIQQEFMLMLYAVWQQSLFRQRTVSYQELFANEKQTKSLNSYTEADQASRKSTVRYGELPPPSHLYN
ncbi:hypothetical protein Anapl_14082 [Anas platyrhynchos]|uniref:Uncharacterized protein n=1 Tax=Anas platyrhynchos TaxID=8839 RepID=R0LA64_ANAPL|nr:hypothetical protein Anapl_14082 [Anas platyrhynchos]